MRHFYEFLCLTERRRSRKGYAVFLCSYSACDEIQIIFQKKNAKAGIAAKAGGAVGGFRRVCDVYNAGIVGACGGRELDGGDFHRMVHDDELEHRRVADGER